MNIQLVKLLEIVSQVGVPVFIAVWYFIRIEPRSIEIGKKNYENQKELKEAINSLASSINNIIGVQNDTKDKVEELERRIEKTKEWDIGSYCSQVLNIMKLTIHKYKDYLHSVVDRNSLFENKDIIRQEVSDEINKLMNSGRQKIKSIPFSSRFDNELFEETGKMKQLAFKRVSDILDVKDDNYYKQGLMRRLNSLAKEIEVLLENKMEILKEKWRN